MLVGSGITDIGGTLFLYKSDDLIDWDYLQPIWTANLTGNDEVWECPALFRLNDQHVVLLSIQPEFRHTYYSVGRYADCRYVPDTVGKTDFGPYFYAAQTMLDDQGRRLMWGWIKEGRPVEARKAAGWAGVHVFAARFVTGCRWASTHGAADRNTIHSRRTSPNHKRWRAGGNDPHAGWHERRLA